MDAWDSFWRELDLWRESGRTATFWWRDDDATRVTPQLEDLLALSDQTATPLALAVIPRDLDDGLRERLIGHERVFVLQHGWAHANHAPSDERKEEFGPHRPMDDRIEELADGWDRVAAFARALPVLVAPWNRLDLNLVPQLLHAGLSGVSTLGPRTSADPAPGVRCLNVHVDIVNWQGGGGYMGDDGVLRQFVDHLAARRTERCDPSEPTGLMTHHLFHDEGCWGFVHALLERTRHHPAVRWLATDRAFQA